MTTPHPDHALVAEVIDGNEAAAESLLGRIHTPMYNLALRFFWEQADAEDATQDILLKILTRLRSYRGESSFATWAHRVATRHLLNAKRTQTEQIRFEEGTQYLAEGLTYPAYHGADQALLETEVKIACSTIMLVCLSRPLRLAYLVGEILAFNGPEATYILDIKAPTFRKRLSLARKKIRTFMAGHCGLYNLQNACRCAKQITYCMDAQWFTPDRLRFADKGDLPTEITQIQTEIETAISEVGIFHSHPQYHTPEAVLQAIRTWMTESQFPRLHT